MAVHAITIYIIKMDSISIHVKSVAVVPVAVCVGTIRMVTLPIYRNTTAVAISSHVEGVDGAQGSGACATGTGGYVGEKCSRRHADFDMLSEALSALGI
jgi:hypothetical protein